jgi:hypothetical protein
MMSSATSTKPTAATTAPPSDSDPSLRPWQFFVLAGLGCATAVTWLARTQGFTSVLLLTVLMGTASLAALAALRTIRPLMSADIDRTPMAGARTRAALEREKMLTLRAIKELEFDRAMKKVSEEDFREMSGRLRRRAGRLIRQLDAGAGYRERIEKDLARRLGEPAVAGEPSSVASPPVVAAAASTVPCAACATANDADARFCKSCGARL